ncbi:MAG: Fe-S cluster assembly protein NifU [Candidatus Hydrogenedentes bacterium]|nr:Fe-S cluster assembly protein NifU [Candidatus Hydrogenedentota bacterium]
MWDYSETVKDHFLNPRNVGVIKDPDGIGEVGSLACGDALTLMFKLDSEGRIADVKFQTFGCASAIASSSALTEMIKGMTIEEAEKITNKDIADFLGGLPEQKMHCSVMGREALEEAIANYRGAKTHKKEIEGEIVCTCFGVTDHEIEQVIRENNLSSVEDVTNYCKAGGGCGGCKGEIAAILSRVRGESIVLETHRKPKKPLTNIQKIKLIEETIEREIRPRLRQDGGDIELVDVDGNTVYVSFRGACAQCRVSEFTMKDVVEARLREFVSADLVVEETQS